jgi:hypothetical protein
VVSITAVAFAEVGVGIAKKSAVLVGVGASIPIEAALLADGGGGDLGGDAVARAILSLAHPKRAAAAAATLALAGDREVEPPKIKRRILVMEPREAALRSEKKSPSPRQSTRERSLEGLAKAEKEVHGANFEPGEEEFYHDDGVFGNDDDGGGFVNDDDKGEFELPPSVDHPIASRVDRTKGRQSSHVAEMRPSRSNSLRNNPYRNSSL